MFLNGNANGSSFCFGSAIFRKTTSSVSANGSANVNWTSCGFCCAIYAIGGTSSSAATSCSESGSGIWMKTWRSATSQS